MFGDEIEGFSWKGEKFEGEKDEEVFLNEKKTVEFMLNFF